MGGNDAFAIFGHEIPGATGLLFTDDPDQAAHGQRRHRWLAQFGRRINKGTGSNDTVSGRDDITNGRFRHVTRITIRIRLHPGPAVRPVENAQGLAEQQFGIDTGDKVRRGPQADDRYHDLCGRSADETIGLHRPLQFFVGEIGAEDIQAAVEHHGVHVQRLDMTGLINNQIPEFFQIKRTCDGALYHDIAPVPLIPGPVNQP